MFASGQTRALANAKAKAQLRGKEGRRKGREPNPTQPNPTHRNLRTLSAVTGLGLASPGAEPGPNRESADGAYEISDGRIACSALGARGLTLEPCSGRERHAGRQAGGRIECRHSSWLEAGVIGGGVWVCMIYSSLGQGPQFEGPAIVEAGRQAGS
ncbi:hypothetical protein AXG93_2253s1040 [Marchantia polymorpha subsp. ruderalis]|uniref:Uncharacterized protein n=1 Tax=Marchantia polymorpha subsp. ruderalis TaxID=1480154 RepID=A0A176VTG6_MARPO|nr:hypothetical protein AXG93_2253s1040 [Marchantia polymorpha subsp. ruderalis]